MGADLADVTVLTTVETLDSASSAIVHSIRLATVKVSRVAVAAVGGAAVSVSVVFCPIVVVMVRRATVRPLEHVARLISCRTVVAIVVARVSVHLMVVSVVVTIWVIVSISVTVFTTQILLSVTRVEVATCAVLAVTIEVIRSGVVWSDRICRDKGFCFESWRSCRVCTGEREQS